MDIRLRLHILADYAYLDESVLEPPSTVYDGWRVRVVPSTLR